MKLMMATLFAFSLVCCSGLSAAVASDQIVDQATGLAFPRDISFSTGGNEYHLQATGVATRKKFIVKVYSVAHYIQDPSALGGSDKYQAILDSNQAKQLTLKFDRTLTADQIQDGYRDSFQKELSTAEQAELKSEVDVYLKAFGGGVQKGDEQVLRWLPGGRVEVIIGGNNAATISNPKFAKHLWAIWFGSHSVVDRAALISLLK